MNRTIIGGILTLLAAGILACGPSVDDNDTVVNEYDEPILEEGETATGAYQNQDMFVMNSTNELETLERDMEELKADVQESGRETNQEVQAEIQSWEQELQELEAKLENASAEAGQDWEQFQTDVNQQIAELRRSFGDLSNRLQASVE